MCASNNIPSPRLEAKRRRSNWLNSCFGIFEEYEPVIYHSETYSASPANSQRPEMYYYASPSPLPSIRERRRNDWLNSCCGIFEEYDPVIHHPQTHSASPIVANARDEDVRDESRVSGSIWRKNIMMGGKCKMPDFSGVIIYDVAGNLVSNSKPPPLALTWK